MKNPNSRHSAFIKVSDPDMVWKVGKFSGSFEIDGQLLHIEVATMAGEPSVYFQLAAGEVEVSFEETVIRVRNFLSNKFHTHVSLIDIRSVYRGA